MYKKLHIKMTCFCGALTGLILLLMTLAGLIAFEKLLLKNDSAVHDNTVHTVLTSLEGEEYIDYNKIGKLADTGVYTVVIYENEASYSLHLSAFQNELVDKAVRTALEAHSFDVKNPPSSYNSIKQLEFPLSYKGGKYTASFASVSYKYGTFCVALLYSQARVLRQITQLRIFFAVVDFTALVLLFGAAWLYTGRMLSPLEVNRRKQSQFIASASHELRSPLAVLLSSADALAVADANDRESFHDIIRAEGLRMSRLIDDMLSLASADSQTWPMHFERTALDELIPQLYEKFQPLAKEKGLRMAVSLPPLEDTPTAFCDAGRICQVMGILLDNALSYTPAGGTITLGLSPDKVGLSPDKSGWRLWVADTGPGIPDEWKTHIFERFFRADQAREDRKHFGLGLSIAGEIIRLHNGRIWVEDAEEKGAVFCLYLPAYRD